MSSSLLLLMLPAVASNLVAVYCIKAAQGMTQPWPSFGMVVSILFTQWLISQAMHQGTSMTLAIMLVVVSVMVGTALIGLFLFHEPLPPLKIIGLALAVAGVVAVSMAEGK